MALIPTRSETAANWAASTVILANGEVVIETDTGIVKVGDGVRTYPYLPVYDVQQTSAQKAANTSDETGSGAQVYATSPTLVTPVLGVASATSINGSTIPTSKTLVVTTDKISALASTSSSELAGKISDETGTGALVFGTAPTLLQPVLTYSVTNDISASATQTQVAATALTTTFNRVVTVGSDGDAVKLPAATAGLMVYIKNAHASNGVGIFPASGDAINALGADAVYAMAATKAALFFCVVAGTWGTILTA